MCCDVTKVKEDAKVGLDLQRSKIRWNGSMKPEEIQCEIYRPVRESRMMQIRDASTLIELGCS